MISTWTGMAAFGLFLGAAAGFVMHRSGYCLAAMFRDPFLFRDFFLLRTLLLLVVVSMLSFEGARRAGLLPFYPFPLLGPPSLANLAGGFLFGIGMVLAGGCVVGTLYKMGAGGLASGFAFLGLIAGSALYAEIHPAWARFAKAGSIPVGGVTVPIALGIDPLIPVLAVAGPSALLFARWNREGKWTRNSPARGYLQPWIAALLLSAIGLASYLAVGMPLGITTSYAKIAAYLESAVFPDHVARLAFFRAVPLDVRSPATGLLLRGGAGPVLDAIGAVQFPVVGGIVLGSALSASLLGEFHVHRAVPASQRAIAFTGGTILGLASRMTPGCNVWHLLGGLPLLAFQSLLFLAGIVPGAWAGGRILLRLLAERRG